MGDGRNALLPPRSRTARISIRKFIRKLIRNQRDRRKPEIRNQLNKLSSQDILEFSKTPKEDNGLENSDKLERTESKEFYKNSLGAKLLLKMIDSSKIDPKRCA